MDTLLSGLLERMDIDDFAEVCDTLSWKFADNGAQMFDTVRSWLDGDDVVRVEAALTVNRGFLFRTRAGMEAAFAALTDRLPQFHARTREILGAWDAQMRPKAVRDVIEGNRPIAKAAEIYGLSVERLRRWVDEAGESE
jgi:hypothetical protein